MQSPRTITVVVAVGVAAAGVLGHTSRLPGRFDKPNWDGAIPIGGCSPTFIVEGRKYNMTALQVDVGGYIANNNMDNFSYCINLCKVVTSERNCVCYACGGQEYPAAKILDETGGKGQTCQAYLGTLAAAKWSQLKTGDGVTLTYGGGEGGDSAVIDMPCDPSDDGINGPTFVGTKGAAYHFVWNTSYACGR